MSNLSKMLSSGVVAVMRNLPYEDTENIAEALISGGITNLEITTDSESYLETISTLKAKFGGKALIGAGTVLDSGTAEKAIEAGAEFIFSPILDEETIKIVKEKGKIMVPGIFSPTEAFKAINLGADMVKLFPAETVGPAFIKAIKGPLPDIKIMPTGGVNINTIEAFISAGASAVGAGSSLLDKSLIRDKDWKSLSNLAMEFTERVQNIREKE